MEEKYTKNYKHELDQLFELAWLNFYQSPEDYYTLERYQYIYDSLQMLIIRENVEKNKDAQEKIMLLKLLKKMYEEIVLNQLKTKSQKQGLKSAEVKAQLYEKIFGEKLKNKEQENDLSNRKNADIDENNRPQSIQVKRNLDFDELYNPQLIKTNQKGDKEVEFYPKLASKEFDERLGDTNITIRPIGILKYVNVFGLQSYVNKYSIAISRKENERYSVYTKNAYSSIDINKMTRDKEYKKAIVEQLFSNENMEKQKNAEYLGEIVKKSDETGYEIFYSSEEYTAIRAYNKQKERKIQEILKEDTEKER